MRFGAWLTTAVGLVASRRGGSRRPGAADLDPATGVPRLVAGATAGRDLRRARPVRATPPLPFERPGPESQLGFGAFVYPVVITRGRTLLPYSRAGSNVRSGSQRTARRRPTMRNQPRRTYGGYTITELRRHAVEHKIPGRSRMDGDELLTAVRVAWRAQREAKEAAVVKSATQGARLRFATHPGCVIVVTSRVHVDHKHEGPLYVRGEYVAMCDTCAAGRPHEIALRLANRDASTYRFYLHSLEAVPSDDDPAKAQRRADATGIAQLSAGSSVARTVTEAILAGDDATLSAMLTAAVESRAA